MPQSVARLLCDSLEVHDVDQVYCVPGESYIGLTSTMVERNSIRVVVCRHEGGAGFMAAADGRLRNRAGVCLVSRGPGLSNGIVALHSAYHDATPLVMLIGQVERKDFGRQALQEQDYSLLLADITKSVIHVNEPETASEAIARAFHTAESGTPGPVAVILPEDVFDEETDAPVDQPRPQLRAAAREEDLDRLIAMIEKAERAAGAGRRRADGRCGRRPRGLRRPEPARGGMGAADFPHPPPPATVRRPPSELWRLHGYPRAAGADRRDEKGGPDDLPGRAPDGYGQPVLQLPDRAAAAAAVGARLAGCKRGWPGLAAGSGHPRQPARGDQGAAEARRPGR